MKVSLFTNGKSTIIACTNENDVHNIFTEEFDSRLIFENPDLVYHRLQNILSNWLNIDSYNKISEFIFSLSGSMDSESHIIVRSYALNDLTRARSYSGFNFNELLRDQIDPTNIYLINDAFATALGVKVSNENIIAPVMILSLGEGVGVSFINEDRTVNSFEWGGDDIPKLNQNIYKMLGRNSIQEILANNFIDTLQEYSDRLINAIEYLSTKYTTINSSIKSLVILGEYTKYVNPSYITKAFNNINIEFILENKKRIDIIASGCLNYPKYFKTTNLKILGVEYYSGDQLIKKFNCYIELVEHFAFTNKIANPNNEYKILYSNNTTEVIKIGDIKSQDELRRLKF